MSRSRTMLSLNNGEEAGEPIKGKHTIDRTRQCSNVSRRPNDGDQMNSVNNTLTQPLLRYELQQSVNYSAQDGRRQLGIVFGVLIPVTLCMFSAILFLRLGKPEFSMALFHWISPVQLRLGLT